MDIEISDIVTALCGRDEGKTFFVVGLENGYALIADGKGRRIEKPKRKKLKHLRPAGCRGGRTALKLGEGERVTNGEIRRALAEARAEAPGGEGGMHIG